MCKDSKKQLLNIKTRKSMFDLKLYFYETAYYSANKRLQVSDTLNTNKIENGMHNQRLDIGATVISVLRVLSQVALNDVNV